MALSALLAYQPAQAQAPPIPGAATPGGVQPQLPEKRFEPPPPADLFTIPPVLDRPLDIQAGPRILVTGFRLEGAVDRPDLGLSVAELEELLEAERQKRPQGFTIGELEEAARSITQLYRERGLIVSRAYVPVQDVEDGVVTIAVLEGRLGQVIIENNQRYTTAALRRPLRGLEGEPITKDAVEASVLRLNDYPGLSAFGVFRPGENVGEADLVVTVQNEDPFEASIGVDNYGVETTGQGRAIGSVAWNSPFKQGDRLDATVLRTFDPMEQTFGSLGYTVPLIDGSYWLSLRLSRNDYDIAGELREAGLSGTTDTAELALRKSFVRSRNFNLDGQLSLARKIGEVQQNDTDLFEDDLSVLSAGIGFDHVDTRFSGLNQGGVSLSYGIPDFLGSMGRDGGDEDPPPARRGGSGEFASGEFLKLEASLARLQRISERHSVLLRMAAQYSDDLLTSLEQFAVGGPFSVRGYPVSEVLGDKGVFVSAEWIARAPGIADFPAFAGRTWGEVLEVGAFVDYGRVTLNDPTDFQEETRELSGAGIALQLSLPDRFRARLEVATQLSEGDEPSNDEDPQYWFSMEYQF